MANYDNGKIYAIRSHLTDEIYIGSTTQPLHKRFHQHKTPSNKSTSVKIIAFGDAYIELIENYPCADKNELHRREGEIMRNNLSCVNRKIEGRTDLEYYEDHKPEILARHKQYREAHKPEMASKQHQYYEINKPELASQHKQYREAHKPELAIKRKQYYEDHKQKSINYDKHYCEINKLNISAKKKQYYEINKLKMLAQHRQYRETKKIDCLMADLD